MLANVGYPVEALQEGGSLYPYFPALLCVSCDLLV